MLKLGAQSALIVVDVQNDFCPGGALAVEAAHEVVPLINRIAPLFNILVCTQDWHPQEHESFADNHPGAEPFSVTQMPYGPQVLWPAHCVQGSAGAEFHPDLLTGHADVVIRKGSHPHIDSYSTFYENDRTTPTGLAGYLRERGVTDVWLAGIATDFCVHYSALDAVSHGFSATVLLDACRAIDLNGSLEAAMAEMREAGIRPARTDDLVA